MTVTVRVAVVAPHSFVATKLIVELLTPVKTTEPGFKLVEDAGVPPGNDHA